MKIRFIIQLGSHYSDIPHEPSWDDKGLFINYLIGWGQQVAL